MPKKECSYSYGADSLICGDLVTDTLTRGINQRYSLPELVLGGGDEDGGMLDATGTGIINLGGRKHLVISKVSRRQSKKSSYCLAPITPEAEANISSKINLGSKTMTSGSDVVNTCLAAKKPDSFHYRTSEATSVGKKRLA